MRMKWLLCAALCWSVAGSRADVFEQDEILRRMTNAAEWQLSNSFGFPAQQWHCAPFFMGLSDLSEISGNRKYIDAAKTIAQKNDWNLAKRPYHADDHAVGQVYLKLYQLDHDPAMIAKIQKRFNWILAHPPKQETKAKDGTVRKVYNQDRWSWCDALYMAPPVWAGLSTVTGDKKYLDYMLQEWKQTTEWLWDADEGLYYRDRSFIGKLTPNGKKLFWARGDGWVVSGLTEVLQYLPKDHPERGYFENTFKTMMARLKTIQKENGIWAPSLLDPEQIAQDETSGTSFYCYGMAWGINNGLLDRTEYEPTVRKAWAALCERQKEEGRLINVQPVGASPHGFDPDSTVIYGIGAFISAGSEVYSLSSRNIHPKRSSEQ